jgi:hypothetical protein
LISAVLTQYLRRAQLTFENGTSQKKGTISPYLPFINVLISWSFLHTNGKFGEKLPSTPWEARVLGIKAYFFRTLQCIFSSISTLLGNIWAKSTHTTTCKVDADALLALGQMHKYRLELSPAFELFERVANHKGASKPAKATALRETASLFHIAGDVETAQEVRRFCVVSWVCFGHCNDIIVSEYSGYVGL